jgi:hypothetical protein
VNVLVRCLVVTALFVGHVGYALRAAATALGAHSDKPHVENRADAVWRAAAIAALAGRADANSLAAAAALAFGGEAQHPSALELAARASALAPDDAAIGWIQVRLCANTVGCDVRDAATAMRWLDPDNAAAWLPTLAAALRDRDSFEVDRVLADMAQGERFDIYWNRIVVITFDALKAVSKSLPRGVVDSDSARFGLVVGVVAAEVVPPFTPLLEACHESLPGTERRESCQKIAKNMQQGDTIVAEIAGLNLEKRFVAGDGREFRALAERRRVLDWRVANADLFDATMLPWLRNAHARWRVARMRSLRRDEDVLLAILREQGLPLDPPEVK